MAIVVTGGTKLPMPSEKVQAHKDTLIPKRASVESVKADEGR